MKFKGNFGELELSIDGHAATGKYQENGTLSGEYTDNIFKGVWHNKGLSGLIEFSIIDGKLDGKWKKGLEPGAMKSKWEGYQLVKEKVEKELEANNKELEFVKKNNSTEKKVSSEPGYLSQLYQNEDFSFLCSCVDTSVHYSPNTIEKILVSAIKTNNKEIEKYCYDCYKLKGNNVLKSNEYNKWSGVRNIVKENNLEENYERKFERKIDKNTNNTSKANNTINDEKFVNQNYDNGDKFEGILINGKRNGKGKYTFANGNFDDGIFEGDKFLKGKVQRTNSNGYKYIGDLENGKRHGEGKLYDPNNNIIESGVFVNGVFYQDYIDWKKEVIVFGKTNGHSTLLGNILSTNKKINFNDLKAEIEDLYKLEKHKIIVEKCIRFIDKDESFLNIEEASCYLLRSIEKLHLDNNNLNKLINKAYGMFPKNETIKVLWVNNIMLDVFEFDKKATLGKSTNDNEYYKEDNSITYGAGIFARPLSLTYDYESKEIIESKLRLINLTKKVDFDDKDLKGKINSIEEKLKLTLKFYEDTQKEKEKNRREEKIAQEIKPTQVIKEKLETKINSNQGSSFEITYEVKLKQEAGFFNTISAHKQAIESGKGFLNAMSTSSKKGGFRERTIQIKHDKNSLSNTEAKNYVLKKDTDVKKGIAGSSTISIISIKKWNGHNYK
jgi:hypothetical protein